jgi:threonine aldolase
METGTEKRKQFASDNCSGMCPEAWDALAAANHGHAPGYGDDPWTRRACALLREIFETDCEVFFVFNGTAANALALASCCQSYHAVLCHETAHVETDECSAPEFFTNGAKVLLIPGENGKISPAAIEERARRRRDLHFPKAQAVSITQATEVGTVYSLEEIKAIGETTRKLELRFHMDGARFANAVASLGVAPKELTWQAGVDVLTFGGTKNGAAIGDAVVFFNSELAGEFEYRCKQAGQLASKMRFIAAPWVAMLQDGAWLRRASHANEMTALLARELGALHGLNILYPPQSNAIFVEMPQLAIAALHAKGWQFYSFAGRGRGWRFMCSWDTTREDIEAFVSDIRSALAEQKYSDHGMDDTAKPAAQS